MYRTRLLLVGLSLSLLVGCTSSRCCSHPWFSSIFNRSCCLPSCCEASPCCDSCDSCGSCSSCGNGSSYSPTVVSPSVANSPIFSSSPVVGSGLPPTAVPVQHGAAAPAAAVPQQPLAKPMPYVPNIK